MEAKSRTENSNIFCLILLHLESLIILLATTSLTLLVLFATTSLIHLM